MAAAFVRDDEVRSAFERVCWVSVGQEPDTAALQQTLYKQLVTRVLPEAATMDEQLALAELKEAATNLSVLLVLDDVWVDSHATPLNFIDPSSTTSAVMVTTRIRSLLGGASEVQCEVMSEAAALELLLRTGGCEDLLEAPPRAAIEAVKACGRLPLALGIAGGMITQLADTWQKEAQFLASNSNPYPYPSPKSNLNPMLTLTLNSWASCLRRSSKVARHPLRSAW